MHFAGSVSLSGDVVTVDGVNIDVSKLSLIPGATVTPVVAFSVTALNKCALCLCHTLQ